MPAYPDDDARHGYITLPELKAYLAVTANADDDLLWDAIETASRGIDKHCARRFYRDVDPITAEPVATARLYYPDAAGCCDVDDIATTDDLEIAVDTSGAGTYATVWSAGDYWLEPLNGIVDGESGWPYNRIRATAGAAFPSGAAGGRATVQVTAVWGWAIVPAGVRQACKILAAELHQLKGAPFGVAGFGDHGAVRVRDNPKAAKLLGPYERHPVLVA